MNIFIVNEAEHDGSPRTATLATGGENMVQILVLTRMKQGNNVST